MLVNRVNVTAIGLQLEPIVGNSATWSTVVAKVYKIYLPVVRTATWPINNAYRLFLTIIMILN